MPEGMAGGMVGGMAGALVEIGAQGGTALRDDTENQAGNMALALEAGVPSRKCCQTHHIDPFLQQATSCLHDRA